MSREANPIVRLAGRNNRGGLLAVALALMLTGCSSLSWFGGEEDKKGEEETVQAYVEPNPGQAVGLNSVWREGVASSAPKYLLHPGQMAVFGDNIFVGTFQGQVARVMAKEGRTQWRTDLGASVAGGVATDGERVYAGTVQGEMVALRAEDGTELWRVRVANSVASAPRVVGDRLLFVTLDNRTYALDCRTGERKWLHAGLPTGLVVMGAGTPTVEGNTVYVGYSSGELFALSLEDGHKLWSDNLTVLGGRTELDLLQDVDADILLSSHYLYAVNHQGHLVAFQRSGGRVWERSVSALRTPLLKDGRLIVSEMSGDVVALHAEDGAPLWRTRVSDGLLSAPVFFRDRVLVADSKGRLIAMDLDSGRVTGLDHLKEGIFSTPLLANSALFLWSNAGNLLRFE